MGSRRLTIGLPWQTLGHGNLGIDALTRSNIAILRAAAARCNVTPHFILLGARGPVGPDTTDIEQGPRLRLKPLLQGRSEYLRAVRRCDVLFDTSEGDSFSDIYGAERFMYHAGTKIATILAKRPLVLSPQTFGPYESRLARLVARWIIARTKGNYPRDSLSTDAIRALGRDLPLTEAMDVAFRLPFTQQPKHPGAKVQVGINVSGLMFDVRKTTSAKRFSLDYVDFTSRLIRTLLGEGTEIWLIPHVLGGSQDDPDDRTVSEALQRDFPALRIAESFTSASQAKSFISGLDFFVGGRMHACIGAYSAGVPVVPIAYSRKFNGLFGSLGYGRMVDAHQATADEALAITLDAFRNREQVAQEIVPGLERAQARLQRYEDGVTGLLEEIASSCLQKGN